MPDQQSSNTPAWHPFGHAPWRSLRVMCCSCHKEIDRGLYNDAGVLLCPMCALSVATALWGIDIDRRYGTGPVPTANTLDTPAPR